MVFTQFHVQVKCVRTDNGPEFLLSEYYAKKGILHQRSCVDTPQQNGRVERRHQTILNITRALLMQSFLPAKFWSYAILHSTYLMNRVPSDVLQGQTPYQELYGKLPDLTELKVF